MFVSTMLGFKMFKSSVLIFAMVLVRFKPSNRLKLSKSPVSFLALVLVRYKPSNTSYGFDDELAKFCFDGNSSLKFDDEL